MIDPPDYLEYAERLIDAGYATETDLEGLCEGLREHAADEQETPERREQAVRLLGATMRQQHAHDVVMTCAGEETMLASSIPGMGTAECVRDLLSSLLPHATLQIRSSDDAPRETS